MLKMLIGFVCLIHLETAHARQVIDWGEIYGERPGGGGFLGILVLLIIGGIFIVSFFTSKETRLTTYFWVMPLGSVFGAAIFVIKLDIENKILALLITAATMFIAYKVARLIVTVFIEPALDKESQRRRSKGRFTPPLPPPPEDRPEPGPVETMPTPTKGGTPSIIEPPSVSVLPASEAKLLTTACLAALKHLDIADAFLHPHEKNFSKLNLLIGEAQQRLKMLSQTSELPINAPHDTYVYLNDKMCRVDPLTDFGVWACFYNANETLKRWQDGPPPSDSLISVEDEIRESNFWLGGATQQEPEKTIPSDVEPDPPRCSQADVAKFRSALNESSPFIKESLKAAKLTRRAELISRIETLQRKVAGARRRKAIDFALMLELTQMAGGISTDLDPFEEFDVWHGIYETKQALSDALPEPYSESDQEVS